MFATASDPIFRWLHSSVIPRDPTDPDFLLQSPFAYADDFAVAASSFRTLTFAVSCVQGGGPNCWAPLEASEMLLGTLWQ